ncbi:hypothetical protein [Shinella sumterensis]|uniref:hypothetical protein n=1 Tax=Shinella sumterensis TaxID=1967501 RepID=UPI003F85E7DB
MKFSTQVSLESASGLLSTVVLFLFIVSGAIYLAFPDQHYNTQGWGVLIKYALYFFLLGLLALYVAMNGEFSTATILVALLWVIVVLMGLMAGADMERALLYLIPVAAVLAPPSFQMRAMRLAMPVLLLTIAGAFYEYFVLGGFTRFHPTSYRGISIFINPNNLGITATILTAYVTLLSRGAVRWITIIICWGVILYSGSKTGMGVLLALMVLLVAKANFFRMLMLGLPILSVAAAFVGIGIVEVPLDSTWDRIRQYTDFLVNVEDFMFPFVDGRAYYTDNAILQLWIELGLPAAAAYVSVLLICCINERLRSPLWAVFALSSLTTNIPYLFPLAYMFWFHVGTVIRQTSPDLILSAQANET